MSLMKEAEIGERILSVNHTYFVPVDRSSPAPTEEANDVVSYFFIVFMIHSRI